MLKNTVKEKGKAISVKDYKTFGNLRCQFGTYATSSNVQAPTQQMFKIFEFQNSAKINHIFSGDDIFS